VNNVNGISIIGVRIALSRFEHDPYTNGSVSNIYVYDIANSTMASVSLYPSNKMNPCIFGDVVVWQDSRRGDKDVFMFDLASKIERSVADGPGDQVYPRVWGDWIVYKDQSTTPSRTIAYSISDRTVTTVSTEGGGFPLIYGDRIIYTISGTYLFDLAENRSAKISEKNVARCIWENRIVDIDAQGILLLQFEPKEESGAVLSDVLPYVLIAALVVGGGGACAAMLWMDEGGSKKKGGG